MDYFQGGQAKGSIAQMLMNNEFTPGYMRPYVDEDGHTYVTNLANQRVRADNADATLRKDEWIHLDSAVVQVARQRLGFVNGLRNSGLVYNLGNAMGKMLLQTQTASKRGTAKISMDGLAKGDDDRQAFGLDSLPLPIVHEDFHFTAREIATSRSGGTPLDVEGVTQAAINVAETIEKLHLGTASASKFGGLDIFGLTNYTNNISATITTPVGGSTIGETLVDDLIAMKEALRVKMQYGPFKVYFSPDWDKYLDRDYSGNKGDNTIRDRIGKISNISSAETLDYLPNGYHVYMVQQNMSTIRTVQGMDVTTMRWESEGGMLLNFKVMGIMVPQLRSDFDGNTGICHGAPA